MQWIFVFILPQMFALKQAFHNEQMQYRFSRLSLPRACSQVIRRKGCHRPGWILVEVWRHAECHSAWTHQGTFHRLLALLQARIPQSGYRNCPGTREPLSSEKQGSWPRLCVSFKVTSTCRPTCFTTAEIWYIVPEGSQTFALLSCTGR